jgi:hypothetical protein
VAAQFFMNLRYRNRLFRDEEGDELESEEDARAHAMATANEMIRNTRTHIIRNWFACTFEVTNENGEIIFVLPFGEVARDVPAPDDGEG